MTEPTSTFPTKSTSIADHASQDTKASRVAQFAQHWNFVCGCGRCRGEKVEGYEAEVEGYEVEGSEDGDAVKRDGQDAKGDGFEAEIDLDGDKQAQQS